MQGLHMLLIALIASASIPLARSFLGPAIVGHSVSAGAVLSPAFYRPSIPLYSVSPAEVNTQPFQLLQETTFDLDSPKEGQNINPNSNGDTQSQSPPQQPLQQPFARNERWLEDATDDFLDEQMYPLGSLAEDDLESINTLMVVWARRRSTEAALTVERLLK
jgi:hypothetical protein